MPELPEVETVRRGVEPCVVGATVIAAEAYRAGLRTAFDPGFAARLVGRSVTSVGRRAKTLVIEFSDGTGLGVHLGMTGTLRFENDVWGRRKHDHFSIRFARDGGFFDLVYNDARRFGSVIHLEAGERPHLDRMGIEPTGAAMTGPALSRVLSRTRSPVKSALLDQRRVGGLGNIYVLEALWRARISPFAVSRDLATDQRACALLADAVREVLDEAIRHGGSTLRDYRKADGSRGGFQDRFAVYGRDGKACPRVGCGGVVRRLVQAGRPTFWCPRCQVEVE